MSEGQDWRMPASQADGAKMFPVGVGSGVSIAFSPYRDAERPHAGGGIWAMLLVEDNLHVTATIHVFYTTPEKADPAKQGQGKAFFHVHIFPEQIVESPRERPLMLPPLAEGANELDYALCLLRNPMWVRSVIAADLHWREASDFTDSQLAEAVDAIRSFYCSEEGLALARAHGAPPDWITRQEIIAADEATR